MSYAGYNKTFGPNKTRIQSENTTTLIFWWYKILFENTKTETKTRTEFEQAINVQIHGMLFVREERFVSWQWEPRRIGWDGHAAEAGETKKAYRISGGQTTCKIWELGG
jgi:hypothetical protein